MSASSSSPSVIAWLRAKFVFCDTSAVGTTDADALPVRAKVKPAALNTGAAPLANRFFLFEACFTGCMVGSSERCKKHSSGHNSTPRK
jgi:hypothetical protein